MNMSSQQTKIEFVGGGTGGNVYPVSDGSVAGGAGKAITTGDPTSLIVFALCVVAIIGLLAAAFLMRRAMESSSYGVSKGFSNGKGGEVIVRRSGVIGNDGFTPRSNKMKSIAEVVAVTAGLSLVFALFLGAFQYASAAGTAGAIGAGMADAGASSTIVVTVKAYVDEEKGTVTVEDSVIENASNDDLRLVSSKLDITGATNILPLLAGSSLTVHGLDGTVFDGPPDGKLYTDTPKTTLRAGEKAVLTYRVNNLEMGKAVQLVGRGDVLLLDMVFAPVDPVATTYVVDFDLNGHGDAAPSMQLVEEGGKAVRPATDPVAEGYAFGGWFKEAECLNAWDFDKDVVMADTMLYAKWTRTPGPGPAPATYTVSFDLNGHGSVAPDAQVVEEGGKVAYPAEDPVAQGYDFGGWFKEAECLSAWDFDKDVVMADTTLYAKWTPVPGPGPVPVTYTVSFNGNGATGGSMEAQAFEEGMPQALEPNGFYKDGYSFAGWSKDSAATTVDYTDGQVIEPSSDMNLYAVWSAKTYSIEFDGNGAASGAMQVQEFVYNDSAKALSANAFGKPGFAFEGWSTSASGAVEYADGQSVSFGDSGTFGPESESVTLYAVWSEKSFSIAFDKNANTATGSTEGVTGFVYNGPAKELTANGFSRAGYTFEGWSTSASGAVEFADGQSVSFGDAGDFGDTEETVTLHAVWSAKTYSIEFDGNGSASGSMEAEPFVYNSGYKELSANLFDRPGYTFEGWSTIATGEVEFLDVQAVSFGDDGTFGPEQETVTLYAVWSAKTYSIEFDGNGSVSGTMTAQEFVYNDTAKALSANAFGKPGFAFEGWSTSASGAVEFVDGQLVSFGDDGTFGAESESVTLYAVWSEKSFSIEFDKNAETATGSTAGVEGFVYNGPAKELTANGFERIGYTFEGWSTSASGAVEFADGQAVSFGDSGDFGDEEEVVTLYAVWNAKIYTIVFDKNAADAQGSMPSQEFVYNGGAQALTSNAFECEGYRFAGWATSATGERAFTNGQSVSFGDNGTFDATQDTVTLYALWQTRNFLIQYHRDAASTLPSGYDELEYIQSDGTQYINTLVKDDHDYINKEFIIDVDVTKINHYSNVAGFYIKDYNGKAGYSRGYIAYGSESWNRQNHQSASYALGNTSLGTLKPGSIQIAYPQTLTNRHTIISRAWEGKLYFNSGKYEHTANISFVDPSTAKASYADFELFSASGGFLGTTDRVIAKMYSCKINDYDGTTSTPLRDFVPAAWTGGQTTYSKDGQIITGLLAPGTRGMYDKVTGVFYINSGSGEDFDPEVSQMMKYGDSEFLNIHTITNGNRTFEGWALYPGGPVEYYDGCLSSAPSVSGGPSVQDAVDWDAFPAGTMPILHLYAVWGAGVAPIDDPPSDDTGGTLYIGPIGEQTS